MLRNAPKEQSFKIIYSKLYYFSPIPENDINLLVSVYIYKYLASTKLKKVLKANDFLCNNMHCIL